MPCSFLPIDAPDAQKHPANDVPPAKAKALLADGYSDILIVGGRVCGVKRFNFTTALVVGINEVTYERRYCYEHREHARAALLVWDGAEHPSGPWVKCKGAGIDLFNPEFS